MTDECCTAEDENCVEENICEQITGYSWTGNFSSTVTLGENTQIKTDNFRDEGGVRIDRVNCEQGQIPAGSSVQILDTTPVMIKRVTGTVNGVTQYADNASPYYKIQYEDCPKGNQPGVPGYNANIPCSDCTHGDPVPNPEIQPQTTPCGIQGGMFGDDVRGNNGVGQPCSGIDHKGLDIKNEKGKPVYAMFDANAQLLYEEDGAGYYVLITSLIGSDTIKNYYFHLEEDTRVSGTIKAGDVIGYQGDYGNLASGIAQGTTESHVHIKIRKNGVIVDPLPYFKTTFNETTGAVTSSGCN